MGNTDRRVVVGVDGSQSSTAALRWAYDQAAAWGATLDVVRAWQVPATAAAAPIAGWSIDVGTLEKSVRELCTEQVEAAVAQASRHPVDVRQLMVMDSPAAAVLDVARDADLLVVGSRGLGGFKGLLLGSVSHQVVQHASCPVAIIRAPEADDTASPTDVAGPVVVGVDGSPGSVDAIAFGLREAAAIGAPLVVVAAWSWIDQPGDSFDPNFSADVVRSSAEKAIATARARVPDADVAVEVRVINDLPARALLDAAVSGRLLVVGSRGLGGFKGLLLGSVSEQCVRHAPGPVVVVHPTTD